LLVFGAIAANSTGAWSQAHPDHDKGSIHLEMGPASERELKTKSTSYGATIAIAKPVLDDWLEIELGLTQLVSSGRRQTGVGLIFKKPFQLSQSVELLVGIGPQITRKLDGPDRAASLGIECTLDLMYWVTERVGWYVEPTYGFGTGSRSGERSLGGSAGLLIRW